MRPCRRQIPDGRYAVAQVVQYWDILLPIDQNPRKQDSFRGFFRFAHGDTDNSVSDDSARVMGWLPAEKLPVIFFDFRKYI